MSAPSSADERDGARASARRAAIAALHGPPCTVALALALAASIGCGGPPASAEGTTSQTVTTDPAARGELDHEPITLRMNWPLGMRWRTRTIYEQHVRATAGDREGTLRREVTTTSTVLAATEAVVETHERLDEYQTLRNGQPAVDPDLVAAIGSVFRMTWRAGISEQWVTLSGAPLAGERVVYAGHFPGCPLPDGAVRVGDRWVGHDFGSTGAIAMPYDSHLLEIDRAAGTATIEARTESDSLPGGQAVRATLRARCTVDLANAFPRRLEVDLVIQAVRFDTVVHAEVVREVL